MHRLDVPSSLTGLRRTLRRLSQPEVEVDRPPREVLRPEFLAGLKRLDLIANVLLRGFLQGLHRSPRKGFSAEFSDYRTFVAGDDSRWIDWRLYARTDRMYVKRFEAESALRSTLVIDSTASMGYTSEKDGVEGGPVFSKLGYGVALAAALAYLLQHQRDRVGLFCVGGNERSGHHLPPRSSRHHVNRVLHELSAMRAGGKADIAEALNALAVQERRRGLVVIFSDALCGRAALIDALRRMRYRGHDVIFFQIWDPAEIDPPTTDGISYRDPESHAHFAPLPREEYMRRSREHIVEVRRGCLAAGCEHQFLLTTTAFDRALYRFLRMRKRRH